MIIRTTTLVATVLAFTMTSPASANDIEDFFKSLLNHSIRQSSHGHDDDHHQGPQFQHDDHNHGSQPGYGQQFPPVPQFDHGHQFHQVQQSIPGPSPSVVPIANPGIQQPKLDINGHYVCGQGMRITRVICGGLAEQLGLARGDTIHAINGETIQSRAHFHDLLRDAVVCHGGHACLLVRPACGFPQLVAVHADFPTCHQPVLYNHW